jgi:hypothetical protein
MSGAQSFGAGGVDFVELVHIQKAIWITFSLAGDAKAPLSTKTSTTES